MRDRDKTKEQLINELIETRKQVIELKKTEAILTQAEKETRAAKEQLESFISNTADAIAFADPKGSIFQVNKAYEKIFGWTSQEAAGMKLLTVTDHLVADIEKSFQKVKWGQTVAYEAVRQRKDGLLLDVNVTICPIRNATGNIVAIAGIWRDITIRKQAEKVLKRYQLLSKHARDIILFVRSDGHIIEANEAAANAYGYERTELLSMRIHDLRDSNTEFSIAMDMGQPDSKGILFETVHRRKDGSIFPVEVSSQGTMIDNERVFLNIIRNITQRKRMEEELRKHRDHLEEMVKERTAELIALDERFSIAFNASPSLMAISTFTDERYISVNKSFQRIIGMHPEEVLGRTASELNLWAKPEDRTNMIRLLNGHGKIRNLEMRFRTKLGEERMGLFSAEIIDIQGEQYILSVINDITERKQLEQEMARLDRLHLVGEMAAGIGHEIRNPMTTVRGFLQMLGGKEECIQYKDYYDLMIGELDRANSIITEFLSLAKNKAVELKCQNLNTIVNALYPLVAADAMRVDNHIKVELEDIPDLHLDEKEICQLILNLVRNGLEAMSPGGNLTIRTFTDVDEVVLSVEDQGKGIESGILEKIGTPFFTTKDYGTGLGLAVCYSIADRHNAIIKVETSPTGTNFFVKFKCL